MRFDPYDYAIQEDPYPAYAWLRENDPVHHNEDDGFWTLAKHDDVAAAFRDDLTFSNRMGVSIDEVAWGEHAHQTMSILGLDAPQHMRLRSLVAKGFTPKRVRELEPRIVQLIRETLDPALERGELDWITDFAGRFPMDVISELMGVPAEDRDEVRRLADLLVHREDGVRDVPPAGMDAAVALLTYYEKLIDTKRATPADDLTSALIEADVDGDRLRQAEIVAFLFLMVVAGNETTTKLLGNALFHAHQHPEQLAGLLSGDTPVEPWVEETLRFDNSTQMLARYVTRDVEVRGTTVPAGSKVILLVGSANRDEDVFPDADQYDLGRDTSSMLSFGLGRHFCLGAHLARIEARAALNHFVEHVATYDVDVDAARRVHSVNVRGFTSLPISVEARS
jgi:cytochrome P450